MSRLDHCFLLAAGGERAMAFCKADGSDRQAARRQVEVTLQRDKDYPSFDLAYLGLLDYREMEAEVGSMLEPFEKSGPVWLVFFRWQAEAESAVAGAAASEVGQ